MRGPATGASCGTSSRVRSPSGPATLGVDFPGVARPLPFKEAKAQLLSSFERAYVSALLERHPNNLQKAAAAAGLSRKHLYNLLKAIESGEASGDEPDE